MKSTEDYINKVYEKYEETQRNHIYYKTVKLKKNNNTLIISGLAICMVLFFTLISTKVKDNKKIINGENSNINYVENGNDDTKTYVQYLKTDYKDSFAEDDIKFMVKESDLIAIISGYHNKGSNGIVEDESFIIYTNSDVNVEKIYKSSIGFKNKKITYSEMGGKLLIRDIESKSNYDWSLWEKNYIGNALMDEERETSYFEQIPTKKAILKTDTKYLVFLYYKKNMDSYVLVNKVYGALEYDSNTNMVKNPVTGEFEEFDWDLLNAD